MKFQTLLIGVAAALCSATSLTAQTLTAWAAPVKVVAADGSLTKSAGCEGCPDSGAHSATQLTGDGYAEFVPGAGQRIMAGLGGDLSAATDSATIDYAFSVWPGGTWEIRERGAYRSDGTFSPGDRFRVAVESGRVVYRKNGAAVYTSAVAPVFPLVLDVTLYSVGASLTQATVAASAAAPSPAPAPAPAPSPTGGGPVVSTAGLYSAVTDRQVYAKPALPALARAGASTADPVFQSALHRVTDGATRPGLPNRSYRTPSSPHQNAWSARGSYFYVVSNDGSIVPFAFDAASGTAQRIQPSSTGAGGLIVNFYVEPQFSYVDDSIIYGSVSAGSKRTIDQYDFSTGAYTRILDLDTVRAGLAGTYIGGVASSAGAAERIMVMFGGASQDRHNLVLIFDRANPSNRLLLDTTANTLNGSPIAAPLNFLLHHVAIDRSGRFVMLYPTAADQAATRKAPQAAVWDTATGRITELPISALPYGHDAFGFATWVNQDCCTQTTWDAAQWQLRNLSTPTVTRDVLATVLSPKQVQLSDHTTWNNARPDRMMPFVSATFRYGANATAWRALDDEIFAIQTDMAAGTNPTIWRFAHHRSNTASDLDPTRTSFWYQPRPNVSNNGEWVLFTSNWEKTLGTDPAGDASSSFRQDVFLVQLRPAGGTSTASPAPVAPPATPASRPLMWIDTPSANAALPESFTVAGWAIDEGAGDNAGVDAIDIWAYPSSGGAPVFVASGSHGAARPDVAAAFGTRFAASGFQASGRLAPGSYQLAVFARSRLTGTFNNMRTVTVTIGAGAPRMAIDGPANDANVAQTFTVGGWAFDPNTNAGSGVDAVHVWAYPAAGGAPVFVGAAALGGSRPDVANYFGTVAATSGYSVSGTLPPGAYDLVVFARSSVTGTFNNSQKIRVIVR